MTLVKLDLDTLSVMVIQRSGNRMNEQKVTAKLAAVRCTKVGENDIDQERGSKRSSACEEHYCEVCFNSHAYSVNLGQTRRATHQHQTTPD